MEIKNLQKAAKKVKRAIRKKANFILFADSDLDGTTSLIIVEEALKTLGAQLAKKYFPDREKEGYSLNYKALRCLEEYAPCVLILLDFGIASFQELEKAKKMGFDSIVIDHHEILDKVPKHALVINPKQPKDKTEFKKLSTSTLAYLFVRELLSGNLSPSLDKTWKELAALGVIADMMPEEGANQEMIASGLATIFSSFRLGIQTLLHLAKRDEDSTRAFFSKMVGILNITEINEQHLTEAYLLLSASDKSKAQELAQRLLFESEQRRALVKEITGCLCEKAQQSPDVIVFEGSPDWRQFLTGAIASRVCGKLQKPCFVFRLGKNQSRGSVRVPKDLDAVQALKACSSPLLMYGGHPPAAGFSLNNANLDKFKHCLEQYFTQLKLRGV